MGKGYIVYGSSRSGLEHPLENLKKVGIVEQVQIISAKPESFGDVVDALEVSQASEVYYLSGQSSVGWSFNAPIETLYSVTLGALNVLEACRLANHMPKVFHAGSGEVFGDIGSTRATESTQFQPVSPYGIAKASANLFVKNFRENHSLFACSGILFNHESPLRSEKFVSQKIISAVQRIANGSNEKLVLGNLDIVRDWGWAPEYVEAMWLMLQNPVPEDYIIASGRSTSLKSFVKEAFSAKGLDYEEWVRFDKSFIRQSEIMISQADPSAIRNSLGWCSRSNITEIVSKMLTNDLSQDFEND